MRKSSPSSVSQAEIIQLLLQRKHLLLHGVSMLKGRGLHHRRHRVRLEGRRETLPNLMGLGVGSSSMEVLAERWKGSRNIGRVLERNRGHSYKWS